MANEANVADRYNITLFLLVLAFLGIYYSQINIGLIYGFVTKGSSIKILTAVKTKYSCEDIKMTYNNTHLDKILIYNRVSQSGSKGMRKLIARLGNILDYNVQFDKGKDHHLATEEGQKEILLRMQTFKQPWVFIRHLDFINFTSFAMNTPHHINLIREPLNQMVSSFYFLSHGRKTNITFDECVEQTQMKDCRVPMRRTLTFFCGQEDFCKHATKQTLQRAKQNVVNHYPVVGYLKGFDRFLKLIEAKWPQLFKNASSVYNNMNPAVYSHNHNHKYTIKPKPSERVKRIILPLLKYDYEFYYFIKKRFDCMYDAEMT